MSYKRWASPRTAQPTGLKRTRENGREGVFCIRDPRAACPATKQVKAPEDSALIDRIRCIGNSLRILKKNSWAICSCAVPASLDDFAKDSRS
jgi:hypothetical protein